TTVWRPVTLHRVPLAVPAVLAPIPTLAVTVICVEIGRPKNDLAVQHDQSNRNTLISYAQCVATPRGSYGEVAGLENGESRALIRLGTKNDEVRGDDGDYGHAH